MIPTRNAAGCLPWAGRPFHEIKHGDTAMVEEIKDVLKTVAALANAAGTALEDGKITWSELPLVMPALISLPAAVAGANKIHLSKLTESEKVELQDFLLDELDIPQDSAEEFIERAFKLMGDLYLFIQYARKAMSKS